MSQGHTKTANVGYTITSLYYLQLFGGIVGLLR